MAQEANRRLSNDLLNSEQTNATSNAQHDNNGDSSTSGRRASQLSNSNTNSNTDLAPSSSMAALLAARYIDIQ
jgi:hypothetical protein